ncbi:axial regulator YABBY 2 isoform X1 [Populus alba x Populus x berolinensis]|uniref:Axial regulator YABBY 2 isoform X1 n=1 Tax=Populus alba x Populus x berolinensis TaxID=444605 RepID=A0AAD6QBI6_9ROSI|nr:axial regulator YABBY 2 isoform X1 [Populus alba x Populus x berolinensis]
MSLDVVSERVCYVHCNFCNTILAVSVPSSSLLNIVTVRCGHCGNLLSVNMGASLQTLPLQDPQKLHLINSEDLNKDSGSSSKSNKVTAFKSAEYEPPRMPPIRREFLFLPLTHTGGSPEKRQRVPSAYNRFIKEEIQRIKACNPDISHREAFSTAAKNWAHFPHIHFGLKLDSDKHPKLDHQSSAGEGTQKTNGLYEINGVL